MLEDVKKLSQDEMEKVTGGSYQHLRDEPHCLRDEPHCKACRCKMIYIRGAYRCVNPECEELAKPKAENEVDWY